VSGKKDNSTFRQKIALRREALADCPSPLILETHGGVGKIYGACYAEFPGGAVFEKDARKCDRLARQRPTWGVYESDSEKVLAAGGLADKCFNFLDCDPYGSPWPVIQGFLLSPRPLPDVLHVVVNDGMRQKVRLGGAWHCKDLAEIVAQFGNNLFSVYLEAAKEKLSRVAGKVGYSIDFWSGYYCGSKNDMTHYRAVLKKKKAAAASTPAAA
jgi:hypothetical protein